MSLISQEEDESKRERERRKRDRILSLSLPVSLSLSFLCMFVWFLFYLLSIKNALGTDWFKRNGCVADTRIYGRRWLRFQALLNVLYDWYNV